MTTKVISGQGTGMPGAIRGKDKESDKGGFDAILSMASKPNESDAVSRNDSVGDEGIVQDEDQEQRDKVDASKVDGARPPYDARRPDVVGGTERQDGSSDVGDGDSNVATDDAESVGRTGEEGSLNPQEVIGGLITEVVGISEDELQQILEDMGITLMDLLLNPDQLRQFLLEANHATGEAEFLMNEDLVSQLGQISSAFEGWREEGVVWLKEPQADNLPNAENQGAANGVGDGVFDDLLNAVTRDDDAAVGLEGLGDKNRPAQGSEEALLTADKVTKESSGDAALEMEDAEGDLQGPRIVVDGETAGKEASGEGAAKGQREFPQQTDDAAMKQGAAAEGPLDAIDAFAQNLVARTPDEVAGRAQQVAQMREILTQVVEQIKVMVKPEQTGMEITLNPEYLGKVNLSVVMKEGVATANFIVQNEMVKEALQSQMQVLRDNLEQQGLKVESIEVTVAEYGFEQSTNPNGYEAKKDGGGKADSGQRMRGLDLEGLEEGGADSTEAGSSTNQSTVEWIA